MQRTDMVSKQLRAAFEREPHVKFQMENHRITLAGRGATPRPVLFCYFYNLSFLSRMLRSISSLMR